jgi:hypothetical protein
MKLHPPGPRARLVSVIAACAAALSAFSSPAQAASAQAAATLEDKVKQTGKQETRAYLGSGKASIAIAPEGIDLDYLRGELARQDPDVCVESLTAMRSPPSFAGLSPAERVTTIGNRLRSVSTLKGIEYYSASRGRIRILFEEAYCVASAGSASRVADPQRESLPDREEAFAYLKDSTFGGNDMRLEYRGGKLPLSMSVENLSAMRIGPITAVKPGRFEIVLSVRDEGEWIVVYALALARSQALPGLRDRIRESASNRVDALLGWISSGLSAPPGGRR